MDADIRTDSIKVAKLGKLLTRAADMVDAIEAREIQLESLERDVAALTATKSTLEVSVADLKAAAEAAKVEAKEAIEAARVNSEGVLVAAKAEAEAALEAARLTLGKAKAAAEDMLKRAEDSKLVIENAVAVKTKELKTLEDKLDKLKAAAKAFAGG